MRTKIFRRIAQAFALLLIVAVPVLNIRGVTLVVGSLYSLSIGPLWITDPLSGFQTVLASLMVDPVLIMSMLVPVLLALVLGRVFCGWLCPQNTLSELLDFIHEKLGLKRFFAPPLSRKPRYIILVALLLSAPLLGFPVANLISAPGIISVQVSKLFYEGFAGAELVLIALIVLAEMVVARRLWCNYVCPVGGFLGIFRTGRTLKVVYREDAEHQCGKCLACADACRLGLDPMGENVYPLCHNCGDCIGVCKNIKGKGSPLEFRF